MIKECKFGLIKIIYYISKIKDKIHIITSIIKKKKAFDKEQLAFMIKILNKVSIRRKLLNLIKVIYEKAIIKVMFNHIRLNAFYL